MPLFISNSKRHSTITWAVTWLTVIIIIITFMVAYEKFLKNKGFMASVTDNENLWSYYRDKASGNPHKLVIIGASRSQLNLSIPYLKEKLSTHDIIQLSINAQYPMATLAALADDQDFIGIVLMSINAQALESRYLSMQQTYNDYYLTSASFDKSLNAYLIAIFESQLRSLHPSLGLHKIVNFYDKHHKWPAPPYTVANLDRSISADYDLTDKQNLQQHFYQGKLKNYQDDPPTPLPKWLDNVALLKNHIKKIEQRGGQVILFRFPTDKGHWQLDEQYYPRHKYWDSISNDPEIKALHFNDIEGMNAFDLPDSSHLDYKDSQAFTETLVQYLLNHKVIRL